MPEPLAIYGASKITYDLVKELYKYVESFVHAEKKAKTIQTRFKTTQFQLDMFRDFFHENEAKFVQGLVEATKLAFEELNTSLIKVKAKIEKYDPSTWRRLGWPFFEKLLDEAEKAMADWVQRMSTTFTILNEPLRSRLGAKLVSLDYQAEMDPLLALKQHIDMKQKQAEVRSLTTDQLLASISTEPENDEVTLNFYWKDSISLNLEGDSDHNAQKTRDFKIEIAKLVEVLKGGDQKLTNIPKAHSWFQRGPREFGIAYKIPRTIHLWPMSQLWYQTPTLADLMKRPAKHALSDRITLAIQIASAAVYIHGFEWVHKKIRSDNVLIVYPKDGVSLTAGLGMAMLIGFNIARRGTPDALSTNIDEDNKLNWQRQIYCHPDRQNINLEAEERKFEASKQQEEEEEAATSAVRAGAPDVQGDTPPKTLSKQGDQSGKMLSPRETDRVAVDENGIELVPWAWEPRPEFYKYKHDVYSVGVVLLEIGCWEVVSLDTSLRTKRPYERRAKLLETAGQKLVQMMGQRYMNIVKGCLDVDNSKWDMQRVLCELYEIKM